MSGDVQPRKRKDKKKKKDDLGVEEPRGTAAALGEGDVFMHSQSDHSTGGHWCAKVIFFSLLGILITLIALIILENRGLTELEANSVESRYSGVLEGWIEDAPDDDHHDEHTLELNHHDVDDEEHGSDLVHDDDHGEDDHDDDDEGDDEHDDDDEKEDDDDAENDESEQDDNDDEEEEQDDNESDGNDNDYDEEDENPESEEQDLNTADNEDEIEETAYKKYYDSYDKANEADDDDLKNDSNEENDDETQSHENDDDGDDVDLKKQNDYLDDNDEEKGNNDNDDDDDDVSHHNDSFEEKDETEDSPPNNIGDEDDDREDDYLQNAAPDKEDEDHEEEDEPVSIEIETIEKEVTDDDAVSTEDPAKDDEEETQNVSEELSPEDDGSVEDDDVEFLEPDELDELPIVEPITAPKGKPLAEVGEAPSTEKPQDTLADEEEYERQQEELRKEREQASQGMWLKLTVGGALLVATHAVLRRATASRETDTEDEPDIREDTPLSDRRMTLVPEPVAPPTAASKMPMAFRQSEKEVKKETTVAQASPPSKNDDEDEEESFGKQPVQPIDPTKDTVDKELYSDEDELEEEIEEDEEEIEPPIPQQPIKPLEQAAPQTHIPDVTKEVTPEPDEDDDDVEIIDEDLLEEELEEEISDVDDAELLNRLEAKYGRLPESDGPGRKNKDGGDSVEDELPGEPADVFWSDHLEQAERDLRQGDWQAALVKASTPKLQTSGRARLVAARALDRAAEAKQDNQLLGQAIAAYLDVLKMNERLSDTKVLEVATRALDRIKFRGTYLSAEPVYKLLIRRFPNEPSYRNNLTISFLMANRADLAENVITETLKLWPNDRIALAHLGFILKTSHNRLEEAVDAFTKALEGDTGPANEPRFYYHLGDALLLLGRFSEAQEIHKRGAALGHFLSPSQRSLYNVDRLKSMPWWDVNQTPYAKLARALEKSWPEILKEGEAAKALYEKEKEGLKERGEWSQLDLFMRGREMPNRCARAPVTCGIVKAEVAASGCRRGQIKFSMMAAGTHVRPHVGPTNCRLRMHLGLSNTKDTFIRVDKEIRQWHLGKVLMFDDSFEHEVWHNGTGTRLVLIVDVWHPDLTPAERRQLPAI